MIPAFATYFVNTDMSYDVTVHIWLGEASDDEVFAARKQILQDIAIPTHPGGDGSNVPRFMRLKIRDTAYSEVILDHAIRSNEIEPVLKEIKNYKGNAFAFQIDSVFDCKLYDDGLDIFEETIHPLTINFFGHEYEWQGHDFKFYGPIRIDFSNTKVFQVPPSLPEIIREKARRREDTTRWLKIIAGISHNFDIVKDLAERVILHINPEHLLVCTDSEVHPLTCHAIYHRNLQDYVWDLKKIAYLHEYGGVYFCDVKPDEPAYQGARKQAPNYGYLRDRYASQTDAELVRRLQPLVSQVLADPSILRLTGSQISSCFQGLTSTIAEPFHNSYYLSVTDPPFAYLEEPYMKLYEMVRRSKNGS
jgi:hypothetical protein